MAGVKRAVQQWEPDSATQEHRVRHGRPPSRAWSHWLRKARELAVRSGRDASAILGDFDQLADLYEWNGETRANAEWRAWADIESLT